MIDLSLGWMRRAGFVVAGAAVMAATLVAGCGGGGSGAGGIAQPAAFTTGPVNGFGSIIVNGVRFDDSTAEVEDEDGNRGSSLKLKLGTMVEIESDKVDDNLHRAKALRIRFGSEIVGPVDSVDSTANTFVALGQVVEVRPTTVFDDSLTGGLAGLAGQVVEVHALFDVASGHYIATRIESATGAALFKLRGLVSALGATTFKIGDATISFANIAAADLPAGFADGSRVRVRLQTTQVNGQWVAVSIRSGVRKVEDHDDARLRGTVTAWTSATAFEVNGIPVDASTARIDNGPVAPGSDVEVVGAAKAGTIIATRVKVLRADDDEVRGIELHGAVSEVDTNANTFLLRGLKVNYTDSTVIFRNGAEAQLLNGASVEVKGVLSADRTSLTALIIDFEG